MAVCCGEDPGGRHWVVQLINGKEIVVLLNFFPKISAVFQFCIKNVGNLHNCLCENRSGISSLS